MGKLGRISKALLTPILIMALLMATLPLVNASDNVKVVEVDTFAWVWVSPNPAQVNTTVLVTIQIDKCNPLALGVTGGEHFKGVTLKITKPDHSIETKGPFTLFAMSGYFITFKPDQIGTYTFQAFFPGQWANTTATYVPYVTNPYAPSTNYFFKPCSSSPKELVVQAEPISKYPDVPLPTDYWTRPINAENKGWWQVADNWLMQGYDYHDRRFPGYTAVAPYTSGPESAHVLWKRPLWFGGIAGGQFGDKSFYTGLSYEQPYIPLIIQGRIIYVEHDPADETNIIGTRCLDLYTGEEIWFLPRVNIAFVQLYDIENPNEHGLIAHLWEISGPSMNTTAKIYDAFTGTYQFTIKNIIWGGGFGTTYSKRGDILSWSILGSRPNRRLILWNSSKAIHETFKWMGFEVGTIYDPLMGRVVDGLLGVQLNVSIPDIPGIIKWINLEDSVIITHNIDPSTYPFTITQAAFNPWTGECLWVKNRTNLYGHYSITRLPYSPRACREGIYVMLDDSKGQLHAYSVKTGEELWVSDPIKEDWAYFDQVIDIAYGKVYLAGYSGHVRAYDAKTGKLVWDYYFGNSSYETAYGTWPVYNGFTIADHKIYVSNDEHSPDSVLWRGGRLVCLNTDSGDLVWSMHGWFRIPAISDGYLTAVNSLDGQIYTFGKGPSSTTIEAPSVVATLGSTIVIKGKVLDESPGQPSTPCVAKESMSAWMEYLHMQKPIPAEVKGVPVDLYAIYPDGTYNYIGTAETNPFAGGSYGFAWKPLMEGTYTIIAIFKGDESYGSSSAGTIIHVTATTPEAEAAQTAVENLKPITTALTAIVIVCIILVAYDIYINRKMLKQAAK
jgi:outer membrane protein assembly factor BamB